MVNIIVDEFDEATNGFGQTVDLLNLYGANQIPLAIVVAATSVTAGAVQLQTGADPGTGAGITWTPVGSPTNVSGGASVKPTQPGGAVRFARVVVTTPIVGGACTALVTV